jgi:hypothetical protein
MTTSPPRSFRSCDGTFCSAEWIIFSRRFYQCRNVISRTVWTRKKVVLFCTHFEIFKCTVRPDWICMRVVPLDWTGLEKVWMCSKCDLFIWTVLQKCGRDINCSLDYGSWQRILTSHNPNQNRATLLADFFMKRSVLANRKTGFYTICDPNKQEVGFIFAWRGSELWSLFNYSRVKLKNKTL